MATPARRPVPNTLFVERRDHGLIRWFVVFGLFGLLF